MISGHKDCPESAVGFIYLITYTDGKRYIGKKLTRAIRRLKPTKVMLAARKNAVRREWKNLPFVKYEGSSDFTEDKTVAAKVILRFCSSKKELSYYEEKELFCNDVLVDERYMNRSIRGIYFKKDLI